MHKRSWWTRARMVDAGAMFYRVHGVAPTNDGWWQELTEFTADVPGGLSNLGHMRPYPCCGSIKKYWKGMRNFWLEVAKKYPELQIQLDKGDLPWSNLEDWWIIETVGLIPRDEVARLMDESNIGRTEAAIKRRLYDLGINAYNRWGWTLHKIESVTGIARNTLLKYIGHGELPYFRGSKCVYVDPADLLVIKEYDWSKRRHPKELERAVRQSLMVRLCYTLLGYDWRKYSYHQLRPAEEFFSSRAKKRTIPKLPAEPPPANIKVGDYARISGEWRFKTPGAKGRVGRVTKIFWSPQRVKATQKSPARPPCWAATIEFPKLKPGGRPEYRRTHYNVPIYAVEKVRKPYERKKPLKRRRLGAVKSTARKLFVRSGPTGRRKAA